MKTHRPGEWIDNTFIVFIVDFYRCQNLPNNYIIFLIKIPVGFLEQLNTFGIIHEWRIKGLWRVKCKFFSEKEEGITLPTDANTKNNKTTVMVCGIHAGTNNCSENWKRMWDKLAYTWESGILQIQHHKPLMVAV